MEPTPSKVSTSIALAPDLRDRLDFAAKAIERPRSWAAGRAIMEWLARQPPTDPNKDAAP